MWKWRVGGRVGRPGRSVERRDAAKIREGLAVEAADPELTVGSEIERATNIGRQARVEFVIERPSRGSVEVDDANVGRKPYAGPRRVGLDVIDELRRNPRIRLRVDRPGRAVELVETCDRADPDVVLLVDGEVAHVVRWWNIRAYPARSVEAPETGRPRGPDRSQAVYREILEAGGGEIPGPLCSVPGAEAVEERSRPEPPLTVHDGSGRGVRRERPRRRTKIVGVISDPSRPIVPADAAPTGADP